MNVSPSFITTQTRLDSAQLSSTRIDYIGTAVARSGLSVRFTFNLQRNPLDKCRLISQPAVFFVALPLLIVSATNVARFIFILPLGQHANSCDSARLVVDWVSIVASSNEWTVINCYAISYANEGQ